MPLSNRVLLARCDAELAEARLRLERLEFEQGIGGHSDPEALDVKILHARARVAELAERREQLAGAAAPAEPSPPELAPATPSPPGAAYGVPQYLDTREAAAMLGVSVKTLEALRSRGKGPAFIRVGRRVRYPLDGLRGK